MIDEWDDLAARYGVKLPKAPKPAPATPPQSVGWWTPERVNQAVNHLQTNAKLSPVGAKALVARWAGVEATGGPEAVNPTSGAFGIAQWLGKRKPGVPSDFEGQLNYAVKELNSTERAAAARLRRAQTEEDAAIGASMFERAEGYDPKTGRDNFVDKTIQTLRKFGGSVPSKPPVDFNNLTEKYLGGTQQPQTDFNDLSSRYLGTPITPNTIAAQMPGDALPPPRPVPETPETIRAQAAAVISGKSTRKALLLTDPSQEELISPEVRAKLVRLARPEGMLYINPVKAKDYDKMPTAVLIGKVDDVADTSQGIALRSQGKDGTELSTSIVQSPESAAKQAEVDQQNFPGQVAEQKIMPAQDAVAARQAVPGITPAPRPSATPQDRDIDAEFEQYVTANDLPRTQATVDEFKKLLKAENAQGGIGELESIGKSAAANKPDINALYADFLKQTGLPDSPESVAEFNLAQKASVEGANEQNRKDFEAAKQPRPSQIKKLTPAERVQAVRSPSKEFTFDVATPKEITGSARQYYLNEMASQMSQRFGLDFAATLRYLSGGSGGTGTLDDAGESDFIETWKSGRPVRLMTDQAAVDNIKQLQGRMWTEDAIKERRNAEWEQIAGDYTAKGEIPSVAALLAAKDVGVTDIKGVPIDDAINRERELFAAATSDINVRPTDDSLGGIGQARLGIETPVGNQRSPEAMQAERAARINEIVQKTMDDSGSFTKQLETDKRRMKEYDPNARPLARPLEFAKGIASNIPQAASAILKYVDIIGEVNPVSWQNLAAKIGGKEFTADEGALYGLAKEIDALEKRVMPADKYLEGYYKTGNTIGQMGIQIGLGTVTGGIAAPLLYGSALGASSGYEEAGKAGAGRYTRQGAAALAGLTAIGDALPLAWALKPVMKGGVGKVLGGLFNTAFKETAKEIGEKEAQSVIKALFKRIVDRSATIAKGMAFETGQEVFADKKITDLYASLTYDPKRKVWTIDGDDLETAFYAAIGGGAAGAGRIALERYVADTDRAASFDVDAVLNDPNADPRDKIIALAEKENEQPKVETLKPIKEEAAPEVKAEQPANREAQEVVNAETVQPTKPKLPKIVPPVPAYKEKAVGLVGERRRGAEQTDVESTSSVNEPDITPSRVDENDPTTFPHKFELTNTVKFKRTYGPSSQYSEITEGRINRIELNSLGEPIYNLTFTDKKGNQRTTTALESEIKSKPVETTEQELRTEPAKEGTVAPDYQELIDIENNLGVYSTRSISPAKRHDAGKLYDAIKKGDAATVARIEKKYAHSGSRGESVTGGPKEIKPADVVDSTITRLARVARGQLQSQPAPAQQEGVKEPSVADVAKVVLEPPNSIIAKLTYGNEKLANVKKDVYRTKTLRGKEYVFHLSTYDLEDGRKRVVLSVGNPEELVDAGAVIRPTKDGVVIETIHKGVTGFSNLGAVLARQIRKQFGNIVPETDAPLSPQGRKATEKLAKREATKASPAVEPRSEAGSLKGEKSVQESQSEGDVAVKSPRTSTRGSKDADVVPSGKVSTTKEIADATPTEPITDFGQRIGGARKDLEHSDRVGKGKKTDQPAWMKDYHIGETKGGKFRPFRANSKTRRIEWESSKDFDTKEEAVEAIKMANVSRKFGVRRSGDTYEVYRKVTNRKFHTIKSGFATLNDAGQYLIDNREELLNYKPQFPERPHIEDLQRTGEDYRKGKDVSTKDFVNEFGFTGGEFGNWVPQDERQRLLNFAYDGLRDLADILHVSPKALSLNGQLSIAFGSRGQGLKGAAAHYERNRAVFNLTRMKGAGSVAHEWFHALDHYFGAQDKGKTLAKDETGYVVGAGDRDTDFLSHGSSYKSQLREETKTAFRDLIATIYKQPKIVEVSVDRYEKQIEHYTKELDRGLKDIATYLTRPYEYARKKEGASAEQLKRLESLIDRIQKGDVGEKTVISSPSKFSIGMSTFEAFKDLNDLAKEVRGRSEFRKDSGRVRSASYAFDNLVVAQQQLAKYQENNKEERVTPTKYHYDAKDLDRMRTGDYWSTEHEMAARAFEAYVEDQLKDRNDLSQYLVHSTQNSVYKLLYGLNPYPEGKERATINKAFEKFFDVVEESEGENGNVALRSTPPTATERTNAGDAEVSGTESLRAVPNTLNVNDIINTKGQIEYGKLKDAAGRVESGEQEIVRLDPEGERGRLAGGKRNVEATLVLTANERASEEAGSRVRPSERQERVLEEYAKHEGIWFDPKEFNTERQGFVSKGVEAYVHRAGDGEAVHKLMDYKMIDRHATPLDFIDNRISLFNALFPETAYELVGFTRIGEDFRFVVKQQFIRDVVYTSPVERQTFMQNKGFQMTDKYGEAFANSLYKVHDLHEKNALKDANGTIYVIDAVPKAKHIQPFEVVEPDTNLRKAADPESEELLVTHLPLAHTEDVVDNAKVTVHADGTAEFNPQASELERRALGTLAEKGRIKDSGQAISGITMSRGDFRLVAKELNAYADNLVKDYDWTEAQVAPIREVAKVNETLAKTAEYNSLWVFDEARTHETVHREERTAGNTDAEAIKALKESPLFKQPGLKFRSKYGKATPANQISEIAAALINNEDYGWQKRPKFEALKKDFLNTWSDGILRKNGIVETNTQEQNLALYNEFARKFPTISEYGNQSKTLKEGRETKEGEPDTGLHPQQSDREGADTEAEEPGAGETFRPAGKEKLSQSPKTMRGNVAAFDKVEDRPYTSTTNIGRVEFANSILDKGTTYARNWLDDQLKDGNNNAGATQAVGLALMNHYATNGGIDAMNDIAKKIVTKGTDNAQAVQAMSIVSQFDPESAAAYASLLKQRKMGKDLTDAERQKATDIATNLDESAKIDALGEAALADANELIKELAAENEAIKESLESKPKESKTDVANLKRQLTRWKNKALGISGTVGRVTRTHRELLERKSDLLARLREKFPDAPLRMVAWHGSPHTFDKFDSSKIGTGEGAQAYGHGLYFASSEEIADHYRDALVDVSDAKLIDGDGKSKPIIIDNEPENYAESIFVRAKGNFDAAIKFLEKEDRPPLSGSSARGIDDFRKRAVARVKELESEGYSYHGAKGAKYRVDLKPAADEYLLWDKPLSEQSEKVKKALSDGIPTDVKNRYRKIIGGLEKLDKSGQINSNEAVDLVTESSRLNAKHPFLSQIDALEKGENWPATGKSLYQELAVRVKGDPAASDYLKSLGIRGIKYLDGNSRGKGEGSYNYVLFDQSDAQILDINGTPITLLEDDAANAERLIDTLGPDIENLRNFRNGQTISKKGFSSLDVPVQNLSLARMFKLAQNLKVRDAIIEAIPVDVVDLLKSVELTPQVLLHNPSVFGNLLSLDRDNPIAGLVDMSGALPLPSAGLRTELGVTSAASKLSVADQTVADGLVGDESAIARASAKLSSPTSINKLRNGLATATAKVLAHTDIIAQPRTFDDADVEIQAILRATPDNFDDTTRQDLIDYTALQILDGKSYKDTIANLTEITKDALDADEVRAIHAQAVETIKGESPTANMTAEKLKEVREKIKNRNEHKRMAREFGGANKNPNLSRLEKELLDIAKNDRERIAALILARTPDLHTWFDTIEETYPDLSKQEKKELYVKATDLKKDAARNLQIRAIENRKGIKLAEGDLERIREEKRVNMVNARRTQKEAENFYNGLVRTKGDVSAETIVNLRRANLLTGIKTHFRNLFGNIGFGTSEESTRMVAWLADRGASVFTGEKTIAGNNPVAIAKSFANIFKADNTLKNIDRVSGIIAAKNILTYGDTLDNLERQNHAESILSEKFTGKVSGKVAKSLDLYINGVFRTLGAEDALFKVYAFRRSLEEQATALAKTEKGDWKAKRDELIHNPTQTMQMIADDYANFMTFQNDNVLSRWFTKFKKLHPAVKTVAETIVPYDRTPTNIVIRVVEHLPITGQAIAIKQALNIRSEPDKYFRNRYRGPVEADLTNEEFEKLSDAEKRERIDEGIAKVWKREKQAKFARTVGRSSLGTSLFMTGFGLAAYGLLTGSMSPDDDDRAETNEFFKRKAMGIENKSLRIPGVGRFVLPDDPASKVLAAGATFYEQMQMSKGDEAVKSWEAGKEVAKDALFEQPLLGSTGQLYNSLKKGKVGEVTGNIVGGYVPTVISDIGEVEDEKARTTSGYKAKTGLHVVNTGNGFQVQDANGIVQGEYDTWKDADAATKGGSVTLKERMNEQGRGFRNNVLRRIPFARRYADESTSVVPPEVRGGMLRRAVRAIDLFNTRPDQPYSPPKK